MSQDLWKELDNVQKLFDQSRKRFAPGGISTEEQKILNRIQAKIDGILKELTARGEIIVVEEPTPPRPSDANGEIQYEGIPLDKLKDSRQQNIARENARRVRDGIKSLDSWSKRLNSAFAHSTKSRERFDALSSRSEAMNESFSKDLKRGAFEKLSKAAGGRALTKTLADYDQSDRDVQTSLSELKEQAFRIAAANALLERAEMALETYDKEKDRGAQAKKLDELTKKLESLKEDAGYFVDKAIDFAKNPAGTLKDIGKDIANKVGGKIKAAVVDEIVDGLLGGASIKNEMAQITRRLDALNKRLEDLKIGRLNAGLTAAFNNLKADEQKANTAKSKLNAAKTAQGNTVGILANLEKNNPGTTTVFGELEKYYRDVQDVGHEAIQSSKDYETALIGTRGAMSHIALLRQTVLKDSSDMRALYPNDWADPAVLQQDEHAKAIVAYANKMDAWYKKQNVDKHIVEQQAFQADLRKNKQFEYIRKLVDEVQKQGLKLPQDDSKIPH